MPPVESEIYNQRTGDLIDDFSLEPNEVKTITTFPTVTLEFECASDDQKGNLRPRGDTSYLLFVKVREIGDQIEERKVINDPKEIEFSGPVTIEVTSRFHDQAIEVWHCPNSKKPSSHKYHKRQPVKV